MAVAALVRPEAGAATSSGPSFLSTMAKASKVAAQTTLGGLINVTRSVLNPREILAPGPVTKAIVRTANTTSSAIASAGTGIQSGFKYATLVLVLVVGLWAWSVIRPR